MSTITEAQKNALFTRLRQIKEANPDGISIEAATQAAIDTILDSARATAEADAEANVVRAELADQLAKNRAWKPFLTSVRPIDIEAIREGVLSFRRNSAAAAAEDRAVTDAAINVGLGVLSAGVPLVLSGGANPASLAAVAAPLTTLILEFVNNGG